MTQDQQRLLGVSLDELTGLLDLQQPGPDHFRGAHTAMSAQTHHVFGGLVAAQALVAAARTVAGDRAPHSLHAYFLRRGDHQVPLELHVTRTRDGGSVSHRRISVEQRGEVIAELSCSFSRPLDGPAHAVPAPAAPAAETITSDHELLADRPDAHPVTRVIDGFELRTVRDEHGPADPYRLWLRSAGTPLDGPALDNPALDNPGVDNPALDNPVLDDPVLHAALLVYASDLRILQPVMRAHDIDQLGPKPAPVVSATIDHTVWFHAPVRVDRWLLMAADSPWAGQGRGLARAEVFTQGGELVASIAQEAMVRYLR